MTLGTYGRLLGTPDARRLAASFVVLGMAGTMTPVAFVLFVQGATGSFATASLALAGSTAGIIIASPLRGRLVDRIGPSRAVLGLAVPGVATDAMFIVAGATGAASGVLIALAFVAGAVTAPAGAALRSVWSETLGEAASRHAAYALMTVMLETTYIAGPLLAGVLIAAWSATAAVAAIAAFSLIGAVAFGASATARRRVGTPKRPGRLAALAGPGIRTVLVTAAAFGLTFGTLDVAFPAFAREHGSTAVAGVLLAALAAGGALGGFAYGLRPRKGPATSQYAALCLLAGAGLAPLIIAPSLPIMVALAVLSGACFAPITTRQVAVVDDLVDKAHRAEAFTWLTTAYGTGLAAGAAIAGQLVQADVLRACFGLACASVLAATIFTTVRGLQAGRAGVTREAQTS